VNFTDISTPSDSVNKRVWNFDDSSSPGDKVTEIHTFAQKGNYNVSLTITNTSTGMEKVANKTIEVGSPVYANFSPNNSAVVPVNTSMLVHFTDLSGPQGEITNWSWNFEDKLPNDTNQSPWHKFTTEGIHNVTLNVSNPYYGAKDVMRTQVNISVQKSPIVDFTFLPDVPSANEIVSFSDGSSGQERNAWLWEFGDGNTSTAVNPTYRYPYAGSYMVNLTVSNPYGNGTASHVVRVKGNVTASFITVPADWGVINQPVTFIDTSKGQPIQWTWSFGDGNITPTQSPQIDHIYTSAGWYTINMTGTNWDGQSGSAVRQLYIDNKTRPRDVDFGVEGKKYSGNYPLTVQFEDFTPSQSNVTEWYWDFGDRTNSFNTTPVAPSHTYTQPGQYTVTLTVRNEAGVNEKMKVAYVVVV
jgi:PKD repeat protein